MSGLRDFGDSVGQYWMADNARFERTNPSFGARLVRGVNPVTGFGSALGSMYEAAGQGSPAGMGIAALSAMPMFAYGRSIKALLPRVAYGLRQWPQNAAAQAASAAYDMNNR